MAFHDENQSDTDERFMREALREAEKAAEKGEVPIGCVVVHDGRIVGRGHNLREQLQDSTAHAEMIAISAACGTIGSWRLEDCTLYVTLEPCSMCAGAIVLSRIGRVVFGPRDPKGGACRSLFQITDDDRLNHTVELTEGVLDERSTLLLKSFFQNLRAKDNRVK